MITTGNSTDILLDFLKKKGDLNLLKKEKWEIIKKYKNYLGQTCRDFYNSEYDVKMLLVEKDENNFDIIQNENFLYYIKNENMKPLYCYVPYLSNKGLTFKFALYTHLENDIITLGPEQLSQKLFQKLFEIFVKNAEKMSEKKVSFLMEDEMFFITNYNTNEIIENLELNNFQFDDRIFKHYVNGFYEEVYPDILDIKYQFPEDSGKNPEQLINVLFKVVSERNLSEINFTRIRKILRKLDLEDLRVARKISLDLDLGNSKKIKDMFQLEIKRRKVNNFIFN